MENQKWYFKTPVLVVALLSVGPLALPLLWFNPRCRRPTKVIVTIITLVLTYVLGKMMDSAIKSILQYYRMAFGS